MRKCRFCKPKRGDATDATLQIQITNVWSEVLEKWLVFVVEILVRDAHYWVISKGRIGDNLYLKVYTIERVCIKHGRGGALFNLDQSKDFNGTICALRLS